MSADPHRRTGRTTRVILAAPIGAVFLCCNHRNAGYTQDLARILTVHGQ